ncbi:unnamed protein product [Penicillium salamii]|uniref:Uncharacterized protein n=1 Tax=Penicillium salamii TaxID=1612424 RepID=A0A9W4JKS6_9EURO|nr:unnamed protein product [Penicillium salamii]CAG8410724.1 unnamed protein product [Penicillium salamii]
MRSHKIPTPKSRRIIKGASNSPLSSFLVNSIVQRCSLEESRLDLQFEDGNARRRDYWRRANEALKGKEEASGVKIISMLTMSYFILLIEMGWWVKDRVLIELIDFWYFWESWSA